MRSWNKLGVQNFAHPGLAHKISKLDPEARILSAGMEEDNNRAHIQSWLWNYLKKAAPEERDKKLL